MIEFVKGAELSKSLEEMIDTADRFLWLISPYIKLSGRIKDDLKKLRKKPEVQVTIVYGKNETDKSKSLSKDDLEFLREFPNIRVCYEKNLHAKYYASENFSLLCSMNLHEFSQNNNIEAGVRLTPKDLLTGVISNTISNSASEANAHEYFLQIIENGDIEFLRKPVYKKGLLGLTSSYTHSETIKDTSVRVSEKTKSIEVSSQKNDRLGYCIRTGVEIPFDISRPFCYDAYKIWVKYQDIDFPEQYCHSTGMQSFGKTSMRNPILK